MAAVPFAEAESSPPYGVLRTSTPAVADNLREVLLPWWTRVYTVEVPPGGTDVKVTRQGVDDAAIGSDYVDVFAGAGPRQFSFTGVRTSTASTSIFVASDPGNSDFIVEAEAAAR